MKENQQKKVFTDATEEENDKEEKTEQTTTIEEQCKVIKRNSSLKLAEPACVVGSTSSLWEGRKRKTQIGIHMYFTSNLEWFQSELIML